MAQTPVKTPVAHPEPEQGTPTMKTRIIAAALLATLAVPAVQAVAQSGKAPSPAFAAKSEAGMKTVRKLVHRNSENGPVIRPVDFHVNTGGLFSATR
jgi:hypothetical protein